jgi:hypothetical protein
LDRSACKKKSARFATGEYKIDYDSIKVLSHVDAKNKTERFNLISSLISASMEEIYLEQKTKGKTLGIFKTEACYRIKGRRNVEFLDRKRKNDIKSAII